MTTLTRYWTRVAALAVFVACVSQADTLYFRKGEQAAGRLEKITANHVIFRTSGGVKTLKRANVTKVQLQQAREFDNVVKADQITDPDLKACVAHSPSPSDFPNDGAVTLLKRVTFDLTKPGTVKETLRTISKVLRERGEDVGSKNVWYFEDTDTPHIDFALTVTPDGRVLHLNDAAVKNESIYSGLPVYRRLARYRFACKEPLPGSILDVQYTVVRKRNTVLEPFYAEETFRSSTPILREEVRVITPGDAGTQSVWKRWVTASLSEHDQSDVQFSATPIAGAPGRTELVWRLAKVARGIRSEPLMPPLKEFAPTLTLAKPATWAGEVAVYAKVLDKEPALPAALKTKAIQLAKSSGARGIYDFVTRTVRTVPVPWPQYSVVPHAPGATASRGVANELDKNFLYLKMLQAAGIKARFALVRDRDAGPLAEDAPSLRSFDRSAVYLSKTRTYSTTASDRYAFGSLPGSLQGSPALVIAPGAKGPRVTQRSGPGKELDAVHFDATLNKDGGLALDVTYRGTGDGAVWMRSLKNLDEDSLRNALQQFASSIHPDAILKKYEKTDLSDLDVAPSLTLHCVIPGYAVKAGKDLMLFNVPCVNYTAGDVGRPTREYDLFWPDVERRTCEGVVHLPKGYQVYAAPKRKSFRSAVAAYKMVLKNRGGAIRYRDMYTLKVREAPRSSYAKYKACNQLRAEITRESVILMRKE